MNYRLIFVFAAIFWASQLSAQVDCSAFFQFQEGVSMEYTNYDKKGKEDGKTVTTVKTVRELPNGAEAEVSNILYDKKGKESFSGDYTIRCEDGVLHMDVSSMLNPAMKESFSNMEVSTEGNELALPNELEVGQELPDAETTIKAGASGINFLNMTVRITGRKVEGKETLTTPAGTFDCFKITQTTDVKMMGNRSFTSTDYYAEGVGMVRSESYDKKGQLDSYMELTRLEK